MLVVVKAYLEVEEPGWQLYDEAFWEKMAATGTRQWKGVDVQIYQETCGSLLKRGLKFGGEYGRVKGMKRQLKDDGQEVCWLFNEGSCRFGESCEFAHRCSWCRSTHNDVLCLRVKNGKYLKK